MKIIEYFYLLNPILIYLQMIRQYNLLKTIPLPYCLLLVSLSIFDNALSQQVPHQHKFISNRIYFNRKGLTSGSPIPSKLKRMVNVSHHPLISSSKSTITSILAVTVNSTGPSCGEEDGSFEVIASGGTPPYQNSVNGMPFRAATTYVQQPPGIYNITVEDANGVTATTSITLINTYPGVNLNSFIYNGASGCTQSDGSITLAVKGGTSPFLYSIDGGALQSGNVFSKLSAGDYEFVVVDSNGCMAGLEFSIGAGNCGISYSYEYTPNYCVPNTGEINLNLTNGEGPGQYSLDGVHFQSNPDFQGLNAGIYTEYVKDGSGRLMIFSFSITQQCNVIVSAITTNASCGASDGSIDATGDEGTAPYSFALDKINFQASGNFNGLSPGTYTVYMKDQTDYIDSVKAVVFSDCPTLQTVTTAAICTQSNGSIVGTGSGGTPPYQYSLDGTNFTGNNSFTSLLAGDYSLILKDANGFTVIAPCTITDNCVTVTASGVDGSCGNSNGIIQAVGHGGTAPYQFSVDDLNFQASSNFNGLAAGPYTVTIKDAGGLTNSATVSVGDQAAPVISAIASAASCKNNDGGISSIVNGGVTPLQYSLDGRIFQDGPDFSLLSSGSYMLTVKDANSCISTHTISVPLDTNLTVNAGAGFTICQGVSQGMNANSNGTAFSWTPTVDLDNAANLDPVANPASTTKYYLSASLGVCRALDSVIVTVLAAPIADPGRDTSICFGQSVQLNGQGGLTYAWSPSTNLDNPTVSDPTVESPTSSLSYSLVVKDGNGCSSLNNSNVTVTVTPSPKIFAGNDTSILVGQPVRLQAVDVNRSGFTLYTWSPALGLNDPSVAAPIATPRENTLYTVRGITPDGCMAEASLSIKVFTVSDLFVPNAFTPNGDGHNDVLRVTSIGMKEFKYFSVYNRSGERLFFSTSPDVGWDGQFGGKMQSPGVYIWICAGINYMGERVDRKGTVILIR